MQAETKPAPILEQIVAAKRRELERSQAAVPLAVLERRAVPRTAGTFRRALLETRSRFAVIAEMKKASPSRGVLRASFNPDEIARSYAASGATALSVLTDHEFFQGGLDDLRTARRAVALPILRKDFTLVDYHLYEAAEAGADAALLIVAILSAAELARLLRLSRSLGLDALVEVHTREELDTALAAGSDLIGVNNRDLRTFEVSLQRSFELIEHIPDGVVAVSESGLRAAADLASLRSAGFDAFLIGERFMTQSDPGAALKVLLGNDSGQAGAGSASR